MSTDISRRRFESVNDFAAVLMQQGRLLLDADWNEWVEILDRRLRAETTDMIGRCVVPKETPDAFKISISGKNLTIGRGRIYVHGILAEHHGQPPNEWDPFLAELRGKTAINYDKQPYLPDSTLIPSPPTTGGPHLVYLDVWRRDVTWLENPRLVESAVGVDSTTRWQTVWQVRVMPDVPEGVTCESEIPAWLDLIRPSAGRLTTDTFNAPGDPDPCLLPPTGGYKGMENRLYRVEIHSVDGAGNATFKWARHNASVATAVREIKGEDLIVDLIGRDADLRLKTGNWVEITDDARELADLPGVMRRIKNVTDATLTITIDGPSLAGMFPTNAGGATLPERHTRIRRWDQQGQVRDTNGNVHFDLNGAASEGVIPVPAGATALLLEDGIQVSFSLDPGIVGGRFHVGDYWVFAARTADASVEKLTQAPPLGHHHHYCRLALVTFPGPPMDCRNFWPPELAGEGCDCSVCVTADSHNQGTLTIQQAIDKVRAAGGTVCLGPGIYNLPESFVSVDGAQSVRIRGQGWRTILAHTGPGPTMVVRGSIGLTVERFTVLTARSAAGSADLVVENSADVTVQECFFVQVGQPEQVKAAIGLGGVLIHTRIRNNVVFASAGIVNASRASHGEDDVLLGGARPLLTLGLCCENNQFICSHHGVQLHGFCIHLGDTVIANNFVNEAFNGGLVATGAVLAAAWGGSRLEVTRNTLRSAGAGIVIGTDDARIHDNDIGPESGSRSGDGIVLEVGLLGRPLNRLQVTSNRIQGVEGNGIHIRSAIRSGLIKQNQIEGVDGGGIVMDEESSAEHLVIENNQLLQVANVTAAASEKEPLLAGIHLVRVRYVDVLNNLLRDIGMRASQARRLTGIQVSVCACIRIAGNRVINLGPIEAGLRDADAIAVIGLYESVDILQNTVRRQENRSAENQDNSLWRAIRIGHEQGRVFPIGSALLIRTKNIEALLTAHRTFIRRLTAESAAIRGNTLAAYGAAPAVQILSSGPTSITDNRASLLPPNKEPVIVAVASAIIFDANYVDGGQGDHDVVSLQVGKGPFTVLGNIASGLIRVNGDRLPPALQNPLNIEMVQL